MKIQALQNFINESYIGWRNTFGENLVGVRVGYKQVKGEEKRRYSLVFHVLKKEKSPQVNIPGFYDIIIPPDGQLRVPTDVVETGPIELQAKIPISSHIHSLRAAEQYGQVIPGKIGFYLRRNGFTYACTCMHVLGYDMLQNGKYAFYKDLQQQSAPDSYLDSEGTYTYGFMEEGIFGGVDAAIARVQNPSFIENFFPRYGQAMDFQVITSHNFSRLKPAFCISKQSILEATIKGFNFPLTITHNGGPVTFNHIIATNRLTQAGDSGTSLFNLINNKLLGIVMGGDTHFTYVIPAWKILSNFNATLLKP